MFIGEYHHTIDEKGRIIMPARLREQLGGRFYISKDLWGKKNEKCLFVYTEQSFNEIVEKLRRMHSSQDEIRQFNRRFFPSVQEGETDKQGRVLISQSLREHISVPSGNIVLAGMDDHIEIWNEEAWYNYNSNEDDLYSSGTLNNDFKENGI